LPHVVLNGEIEMKKIFQSISSITHIDNRVIIKSMKKFIDEEENNVLIESLAGTQDNLHRFLTLVSKRKDGLVVRIYPFTQVEKTNQVQQLLAEIAKQLINFFPNLTVGKTNLHDFLA